LAGRWITLAVRDPIGRIVEGRYALVENAGGERVISSWENRWIREERLKGSQFAALSGL
jgi:hypothetical protein